MNGLQISIVNAIGQSNLGGGIIPPVTTNFIISEQDDFLITETGGLFMIPEYEIIYVFTENNEQIITENNQKIITEI